MKAFEKELQGEPKAKAKEKPTEPVPNGVPVVAVRPKATATKSAAKPKKKLKAPGEIEKATNLAPGRGRLTPRKGAT